MSFQQGIISQKQKRRRNVNKNLRNADGESDTDLRHGERANKKQHQRGENTFSFIEVTHFNDVLQSQQEIAIS